VADRGEATHQVERRHPDALVRRLWAERRIAGTRIAPRTIRFRIRDLDAYAQAHRVEPSR
jgi:hypothetical protein